MIINNWNKYLNFFSSSQRDLYFTEEYHILNSGAEDMPSAFLYQENNKIFLLPFLSRTHYHQNLGLIRDFESAYGYGGPLINTDNTEFIIKALNHLKLELSSAGYIAGFIRFHPLLRNHLYFDFIGNIVENRKTIAIDLTGTEEEIWNSEIHTKNRNVIKKGYKEGLVFYIDNKFEYLNNFLELYYQTMEKVNAEKFYYFEYSYFQKLKELLPKSFISTIIYNNQIISSAIILQAEKYGHYHLAGSDKNHLSVSPNNLLLWETAKELKRKGITKFHLGGGTESDPENSLFKFKKKFSKSDHTFYIGKIIFDNEKYQVLCKQWERDNPNKINLYGNRLLKYRY